MLPKTDDQVASQKRKNEEKQVERKKKLKADAAAKKGLKGKPKGAS